MCVCVCSASHPVMLLLFLIPNVALFEMMLRRGRVPVADFGHAHPPTHSVAVAVAVWLPNEKPMVPSPPRK